jgi:hypothetical protein
VQTVACKAVTVWGVVLSLGCGHADTLDEPYSLLTLFICLTIATAAVGVICICSFTVVSVRLATCTLSKHIMLRLRRLQNTLNYAFCPSHQGAAAPTQPLHEAPHKKQGSHMPVGGATCQELTSRADASFTAAVSSVRALCSQRLTTCTAGARHSGNHLNCPCKQAMPLIGHADWHCGATNR